MVAVPIFYALCINGIGKRCVVSRSIPFTNSPTASFMMKYSKHGEQNDELINKICDL